MEFGTINTSGTGELAPGPYEYSTGPPVPTPEQHYPGPVLATGWLCPYCSVVHAPCVLQCHCQNVPSADGPVTSLGAGPACSR